MIPLKLFAAAVIAWTCWDAGLAEPTQAGLSTFGDPPSLAAVWWMAGLLGLFMVFRAGDRNALARTLTCLLLIGTLAGGKMLPADEGLLLVLMGAALFMAAPTLRPGAAALATLVALIAAIPGLAGSLSPHGSLMWLRDILPPASLALLIPSLFDGASVRRAALVAVLGTGVVCLAALSDYLGLANGLMLPLKSVLATRLRLLGEHPNLSVPHLTAVLVLGCALAWSATRTARPWLIAATAAIAVALYAVRSRTGLAVSTFGVGLLIAALLTTRWSRVARWAHPAAALIVAALLVIPMTGATDPTISRVDSSMVSKAVSFRSSMWELGRDTFTGAPWNGFGPNTRYVQARFARSGRYDGLPKDDHPHNVVLGVATTLGWPGLVGLAALFVVSLRRPRSSNIIAFGAQAALFSVWAADAVDLGSADNTLYPSLVFLLLGIREAADRPAVGDPSMAFGDASMASDFTPDTNPIPSTGTVPAPTHPGLQRATVLVAAGSIAVGGIFTLGAHAKQTVETFLVPHEQQMSAGTHSLLPDQYEPEEAEAVTVALRRAEMLLPLDPAVTLQRARLARLFGQYEEVVEQFELARLQVQDMPFLAHQLALAKARMIPRDVDEEAELLAESVRLDPHGEQSWRRRLDQAQVILVQGHRAEALEVLTDALVLNPGAAAQTRPVRRGDEWVLLPAAEDGRLGLPVADVLTTIEARRAALDQPGSAMDMRFRIRPIEILIAIGDNEAADAMTREVLADNTFYLQLRLASSALARGDWDAALAIYAQHERQDFMTAVDELVARSHQEPVDLESWQLALGATFDMLPDLTFQSGKVRAMIEARRRMSERHGDAVGAVRLAEALEYARR